MLNKKTIKVYWTYTGEPSNYSFLRLTQGLPISVSRDLFKNEHLLESKSRYSTCPAAKDHLRNMFFFRSGLDTSISFDLEKETITGENADWWTLRHGLFYNRPELIFDVGFLFFCEEPLEIDVTTPYLHDTKANQTSSVSSGRFRIDKWFRGINSSYLMHENKNTLAIDKNDPLCYFRFNTDKKIIFNGFESSDLIHNISLSGVRNDNLSKPFTNSLADRYEMFEKSKMSKLLMKEIKKNLIEEN